MSYINVMITAEVGLLLILVIFGGYLLKLVWRLGDDLRGLRTEHHQDMRALRTQREEDRAEHTSQREKDRSEHRQALALLRTETLKNRAADRVEIREGFKQVNQNIDKLREQVGSFAERLARVEGHIGANPPDPDS